jgi:hypothetical protein
MPIITAFNIYPTMNKQYPFQTDLITCIPLVYDISKKKPVPQSADI